jgi:hypothetical protein
MIIPSAEAQKKSWREESTGDVFVLDDRGGLLLSPILFPKAQFLDTSFACRWRHFQQLKILCDNMIVA